MCEIFTDGGLPGSASLESLLQRVSQKAANFKACPDIQAAYLEILNLLARHGSRELVGAYPLPYEDSSTKTLSFRSSALLDMQRVIKLVTDSSATNDLIGLRSHLFMVLCQDVNTACRMLEAIPSIWASDLSQNDRVELCRLYADVCIQASAPDVRGQALSNLSALMDGVLERKELAELPAADVLERVWKSLQEGEINPALSYSIIGASGTFMAALSARSAQDTPNLDQRVRSWGIMIADSLDIDNVSITWHRTATIRLTQTRRALTRDMPQAWH